MKAQKIKNLILAGMLITMSALQLNAQRNENMRSERSERPFGREERMIEMLDLTEDQKQKIESLRTVHMKEMLQFKNELNELKAKQQTLSTAENADMKAINANIDNITSIENKLMKARAKHHQEVRSLLTEEQRVKFDAHKHRKGFGREFGRGHGEHFKHRQHRHCVGM